MIGTKAIDFGVLTCAPACHTDDTGQPDHTLVTTAVTSISRVVISPGRGGAELVLHTRTGLCLRRSMPRGDVGRVEHRAALQGAWAR